MLNVPKQIVTSILINALHARNERVRRRLQQENGIAPAAWGATVNDAGNLSVDGVDLVELADQRVSGVDLVVPVRADEQ